MRSALKWLVGVAVVMAAIAAWQWRAGGDPAREPAGEQATAIATGDLAELVVGEPVRFKNLTIFPVSSTVARDQDRLITLAEGLQSGLVSISEVGAGADGQGEDPPADPQASDRATADAAEDMTATSDDPFAGSAEEAADDAEPAPAADQEPSSVASDDPPAGDQPQSFEDISGDGRMDAWNGGPDVNHLLVTNNSSKPLYLMPGEIMVGGQQDRCVGEELIVAPHTKRMRIEVFCVEHGRWSTRSQDESAELAAQFSEGQAPADAPEAKAKDSGVMFAQTAGYLGKKGRVTVQADQDQAGVWNEVSLVISQTQAVTGSGAFTANYADGEVTGRLEPYVAALQEAVAQTPRVVGVIVAVDGKIQSADTFESTPLFRKLWPKLLKSYALDATLAGDESRDASPDDLAVCDLPRAKAFLHDASQAKANTTCGRDGLVTVHGDADDLVSFSLLESPNSRAQLRGYGGRVGSGGMGGGMMGGMGRGLNLVAAPADDAGAEDAPASSAAAVQGGMGGGFGGGVHSAAYSK